MPGTKRPKISSVRRAKEELFADPAFLAEKDAVYEELGRPTGESVSLNVWINEKLRERALEIEREEEQAKAAKPHDPEPSA